MFNFRKSFFYCADGHLGYNLYLAKPVKDTFPDKENEREFWLIL